MAYTSLRKITNLNDYLFDTLITIIILQSLLYVVTVLDTTYFIHHIFTQLPEDSHFMASSQSGVFLLVVWIEIFQRIYCGYKIRCT